MKKEKGFALIMFLNVLLLLSFLMIINSNKHYSAQYSLKSDKNLRDIELFQNVVLDSTLANFTINNHHIDKIATNEEICSTFNCPKETESELVISFNPECLQEQNESGNPHPVFPTHPGNNGQGHDNGNGNGNWNYNPAGVKCNFYKITTILYKNGSELEFIKEKGK